MQGALGAVKSAAAIAHSQALITPPTSNKIKLEGQDIDMVGTYPAATETGIFLAAQLSSNDFKPSVSGTVLTIESVAKAGCSFTYTLDASGTVAPTFGVGNLTAEKCK